MNKETFEEWYEINFPKEYKNNWDGNFYKSDIDEAWIHQQTKLDQKDERILELDKQLDEANATLNTLANEMQGAIGIEEFSLREILGNTNVECLKLSIEKARKYQFKYSNKKARDVLNELLEGE